MALHSRPPDDRSLAATTSFDIARVVIVDDNPDEGMLLRDLLERRGAPAVRAVLVSSGRECLDYLRDEIADVVVTDLKMPGMSGMELCRELHTRHLDVATIVLTAAADRAHVIDALRAGVHDFIIKPVKTDVIEAAIRRAVQHSAVRHNVKRLRVDSQIAIDGIIGTSPAIRSAIDLTRRAAACEATVLLTGEPGVGKKLFARALHRSSSRATGPFVTVHCESPEPLADAFERAGTGTLFLDEISDMPFEVQAQLVRMVQGRSIACRLVASTNHDLEREMRANRFREDLFYLIDVVQIPVPPLRERTDDIAELARAFVAVAAARAERPPLVVSPPALRRLTSYAWPGNVRELEETIVHAVAAAPGPMIEVSHVEKPHG